MRVANLFPFFERLRADLQDRVIAAGRKRRFRAGQLVQQAGDRDARLSIVRSGRVRVFTLDCEGSEITFDILEPGEALGQLTILANLPRRFNAVALDEVEVVEIAQPDFHRLLDADPGLRRAVLENLAVATSLAMDALDDERRLPLRARLAKALIGLASRQTDDGRSIPLSQSALADYLGVSRVSIGKTLAGLVQDRLVAVSYRKVTLLDPDMLARSGES